MSDSTNPPSNIADKIKQTIDELELDKHANELVIQVESAFTTVREKVGTLAAERGGDVEAFLDKASAAIGERTEGRYSSHVDKVRETVSTAVTRLAEYRPSSTPVTPVEEIEPPTTE
jgi:hypothetical protein